MCSDYAIAQFRYLKRLLLVHGRWSYSRVSFMILNFYLKNVVFTLVLFWYQIYAGFSASVIYEFTYMLLYNIFFTCLPIMVLGIFDQDGDADLLVALPQIYGSEGIAQKLYTHRRFAQYILESLWHSLVCFFIPYLCYGEVSMHAFGYIPSGVYLGTIMGISAILVANLSVALDNHSWTWMSHVAVWGSSMAVFIYISVYSIFPSDILSINVELYLDPKFYFATTLCILLSLGPRFSFYFLQRVFHPTDSQLLEEIRMKVKSGKVSLNSLFSHEKVHTSRPSVDEEEVGSLPVPDAAMLSRKPSNASNHSVTYSMETGDVTTPSGFSFSHTRGMGSVVLRSPLAVLPASPVKSIRPRSSRAASRSKITDSIEKSSRTKDTSTVKLGTPPKKRGGKTVLKENGASPLSFSITATSPTPSVLASATSETDASAGPRLSSLQSSPEPSTNNSPNAVPNPEVTPSTTAEPPTDPAPSTSAAPNTDSKPSDDSKNEKHD